MPGLVVVGERVLTEHGVGPAAIFVEGGRIRRVEALAPGAAADAASLGLLGLGDAELVQAGELLVTPGVVDAHVHINEPGRTEWEGFETATEAAAAGGVTTLVDMPLNCIPATTSRAAADQKREALRDQLHVDVAFWGGVVPGNTGELAGLAAFGVPGAKCFLCPSGVEEFPPVTRADLERAMPVLRDHGLTLLAHAESPEPLAEAEAQLAAEGADPRAYHTYLRSRPNAAEDRAVAMLIELCRATGCPVHVVHLSSASALPALRQAQAESVPITAETCLHYLAFTAEEIPSRATQFKCAPPIREANNRAGLWAGLEDGTLSMVVSDHSPCTPALKCPETGDFLAAWGGIAGLGLGLSVLWTLASARGHDAAWVFERNARGPARLAGLGHRKGAIAAGFDADLVLWDDRATFEVDPELHIRHRHKVTPYAGMTLRGRVHRTFVRGQLVFDRDAGLASRPAGAFLTPDPP